MLVFGVKSFMRCCWAYYLLADLRLMWMPSCFGDSESVSVSFSSVPLRACCSVAWLSSGPAFQLCLLENSLEDRVQACHCVPQRTAAHAAFFGSNEHHTGLFVEALRRGARLQRTCNVVLHGAKLVVHCGY